LYFVQLSDLGVYGYTSDKRVVPVSLLRFRCAASHSVDNGYRRGCSKKIQ
jgi:hypothetical protein